MKIKNMSKLLATAIVLSNLNMYSFAGVLSGDERYETFEGQELIVGDILEADSVDVEIEGNTLVNLMNTSSIPIRVNNYSSVEDKYAFLSECYANRGLRTGQEYTLYVKYRIDSYSALSDVGGRTRILPKFTYADGTEGYFRGFETRNKASSYSEIVKIVPEKNVRLFQVGWAVENAAVSGEFLEVVLLEGDYTKKDIGYFEGLKSVGQNSSDVNKIEVISKTKNMVDINDFYIANNTKHDITISENKVEIHADANRAAYYTQFRIKPELELKTNKKYRVSGKIELENAKNNKAQLLVVSPSRATFIKEDIHVNGDFSETFTVKQDVSQKYIKDMGWEFDLAFEIALYPADSTMPVTATVTDLTLVEEVESSISVPSDYYSGYVPYQSNKKEILMNEPLRGLPNGAKDKIVKKDGQWVVERNIGEITFDGSDDELWKIGAISDGFDTVKFTIYQGIPGKPGQLNSLCDKFEYHKNNWDELPENDKESFSIAGAVGYDPDMNIRIAKSKLNEVSINGLRVWLSNNPITVIYALENPKYDALNIDSNIDLYLDVTHILNNSTIPANMRITVDRATNRAKEAIELAKNHPTVENISQARYWSNLMKNSTLKDEFQNEINMTTDVVDLTIEKKTASVNADVYIKMKNTLSLSLDTNSIVFDDVDVTEDTEMQNAVNLTVSSSLPYRVNAYLEDEIYNTDKSGTLDKSILNIRANGKLTYQAFTDLSSPIMLLDDQEAGVDTIHGIDLKLASNDSHKADVYKASIKFEIEQK